MTLTEKIIMLRKRSALTQEELADRLGVSRQAVSRWETDTAMPDAANILALSRLFGVSADYLLNDEHEEGYDAAVRTTEKTQQMRLRLLMILLLTLEGLCLLMQFICSVILQNVFLGAMSFLPFLAMLGAFEWSYCRYGAAHTENAAFRLRFYQCSAWLGLYFPCRLLVRQLFRLYPRAYSAILPPVVTVALYLLTALGITLALQRRANRNEKNR